MKVIVSKTCANVSGAEMLTSGMVGKTIDVEFSADWIGLTKIAVFTNGETTRDVLNPNGSVVIPWEVLVKPNKRVSVGFYGYKIENGEKALAIPTIWAELGAIRAGADPSGDPSNPPSPEVAEQILAIIGDLENLDTEDKENLVAAINEAYNHGGGGEAILAMRVYEGYIQYTTDNQTWVNLIAVADLKGAKGDKGEQGEQGIQGIQGEQGAKGDKGDTGAQGLQGIQGIQGEKGDKGDTGEKGADGADGVDGQDGYTPVRGTDYWTAADKAEIVDDVLDVIPEIDLTDYALKTDLPQNVSDLTNDSGYLTLSTLPIYDGGVE